jgi:hypothetical protein
VNASRPELEPLEPAVAALLASERAIPAQPAGLRARALLRARNAMAARAVPPVRAPRGAPWRWAMAALWVLVVATLATAGLRPRRESPAPPVKETRAIVRPEPRIADPEPDLTTFDPAAVPAATSASAPRSVRRAATRAEGYAVELALLQPARAALARADFAATLAATAEHERRFPRSALAEERDALAVLALAGARRGAEARRAAEAFRARFSGSLLQRRVDDAVRGLP